MVDGVLTANLSAAQSGRYMLSILSGKDLIAVPVIVGMIPDLNENDTARGLLIHHLTIIA